MSGDTVVTSTAAAVSPGCPDATRPLRRDAAANRDRILCAAAAVFADGGLGATMDDIAARAGLGVGTLYRRFQSKADLVNALFEERVVRVQRLAEEALAYEDAWSGLVYFLEQVEALQSANRGLVNALFDTGGDTAGVERQRARLHALGEQLVRRAQAQGRLRPDVSATDIPLLLLMVSTVDLYTRATASGASARFLALCIDGLRTQRRRPTPLPAPPLTVEELDLSIAPWRPCSEAARDIGHSGA